MIGPGSDKKKEKLCSNELCYELLSETVDKLISKKSYPTIFLRSIISSFGTKIVKNCNSKK